MSDDCRSTTSTQALSCHGVRCRPEYSGGCTNLEYVLSSVQTGCSDPPGASAGSATVCYYDDVCCPIDDAAEGAAVGATSGGVLREEATDNGGDAWEENSPSWWYDSWSGQQSAEQTNGELEAYAEWEEGRHKPHSGENAAEESNGKAAGVAFAFVIMILAVVYVGALRWKRNNAEDEGASRGIDRNAVEVYEERRNRSRRTIHIDSDSDSDSDSDLDSDSDDSSEESLREGGSKFIHFVAYEVTKRGEIGRITPLSSRPRAA